MLIYGTVHLLPFNAKTTYARNINRKTGVKNSERISYNICHLIHYILSYLLYRLNISKYSFSTSENALTV